MQPHPPLISVIYSTVEIQSKVTFYMDYAMYSIKVTRSLLTTVLHKHVVVMTVLIRFWELKARDEWQSSCELL